MQDRPIPTREANVAKVGVEIRVEVEHWRDGHLLSKIRGGDVIGSVGRDVLANRIGTADPAGRVRYIRASAIGTGLAAVSSSGLTKLGSVVYHGTAPFSKSAPTGSFTFNRKFSIGSTYAIRESGLFMGTSQGALLRGTMYSRGTFAVRNVVSGDSLTLNYTGGMTSG